MILEQITLGNFRQFREETISFADGDNGVTVVHGANGSGKTTILNAFTWLFYNEVDFNTRPDRLASEGAMAAADPGDRVEATVEVEFSHDGVEYFAHRYRVYEKQEAGDFDGIRVDQGVEVRRGEGSGLDAVRNPEETLDKVLPERLSELFFFDGEDIDELAGIDNQEQIQEAIQNLMGLTILERAVSHLDTVAGRFRKKVDEHADDERSEIETEIKSIKKNKKSKKSEKDKAKRAKQQVQSEITEIEGKIQGVKDAERLHNNRKRKEKERESELDNIESVNNSLRSTVNSHAAASLAVPLVRATAKDLDEMRKQGKIPSGVSDEYIDSLLDGQTCICGRELEPGTRHYNHLQSLKGDTVVDGVEQTALQIVGHLRQFATSDDEFETRVSTLYDDREGHENKLNTLDQNIAEIERELSDIEKEGPEGNSVSELENMLQKKRSEIESISQRIGKISKEIKLLKEKKEDLKREKEKIKIKNEEARVRKAQKQAAQEVKQELQTTFNHLQDKVRQMCNNIIGETFNDVASKSLAAEVDESFKLRIKQQVGDQQVEVDKSTGERQIASLAFVGSLVQIARRRYESDSQTQYFSGGIYPLVMDSPFGALDKSHRRKVSRVIPEMGNQVVVFATDSQWEGPVEEEMSEHIGQQYWLNFDSGEKEGSYPQTRIKNDRMRAGGD